MRYALGHAASGSGFYMEEKADFSVFFYQCGSVSEALSGVFDSLTPELKKCLENTTFDFNGAWGNLPKINENNFPKLWMANFFSVQEKIWIPTQPLPLLKLKFFEKPLDRNISMSKRNEINETYKSTKVLNLWIEKPVKSDESNISAKYLPESLSLSELAERDWPNATYAVDAQAKTWRCPIIVASSEDKVDPFYKNLFKEYQLLQGDNRRRILCVPMVDKAGLPGISAEVVGGPLVSENGFIAILPTAVPDKRFKKVLAHVINRWVSLEALDQYTVSEDKRAFYAFDRMEEHIKTKEDGELWRKFCSWLKESELTINFVNPILLGEEIIEQKSRNSGLN